MAAGDIAIVLPFYNEEQYLGATLACLHAQRTRPQQVVLVNNASTDTSRDIAQRFAVEFGDACSLVDEPTPGKVHALKTGGERVRCTWTSTWDADTYYPDDYITKIGELASSTAASCVAIMALGLPREAGPARDAVMRDRLALHRKFPSKCFTGGYGQTFRTDALRAVGGFDERIWPYVLMDHEVVHRLHTRGTSLYSASLWCSPAERRSDRGRVRWTAFERLVYRHTPQRFEGWFFHQFLAARFARRGLRHTNLRVQPWGASRRDPEN